MCKEMQEIQIFLRVLFAAAVPRARKGRGSLYRRVRAAIALARLVGPYLLSQGRWLHIYSNRHSKLSQVTLPTLGTIHTLSHHADQVLNNLNARGCSPIPCKHLLS